MKMWRCKSPAINMTTENAFQLQHNSTITISFAFGAKATPRKWQAIFEHLSRNEMKRINVLK